MDNTSDTLLSKSVEDPCYFKDWQNKRHEKQLALIERLSKDEVLKHDVTARLEKINDDILNTKKEMTNSFSHTNKPSDDL